MANPFTNAKVVGSGIDPEAYHRTDEKRGTRNYPMSNSVLGLFEPCPARFIGGYESSDSSSKSTGNLWDTLLLSSHQFPSKYVECPATYEDIGMECPICKSVTDAKTCRACKCDRVEIRTPKPWDWGTTICKDFRKANAGKEPVKAELMQEARAAVSTVRADESLASLIDNAQRQVMVVAEYKDPATGITIPVKALLDLVPDKDGPFGKLLVDSKTTRNAAMRPWQRDCFQFGYGRQAAFHTDLYVAATGEDRNTFGHIVQENIAPFHVEKRILSEEFVELGRAQYMAALALYCRCLATGDWPGYYAPVVLDGWALVSPDAWMAGTEQRPTDPPPTQPYAVAEDDVPTP